MFDRDRLHRKRIAIVIGKVDEECAIVKRHQHCSNLTALQFDGFMGLLVCCAARVHERNKVIILDVSHWA